MVIVIIFVVVRIGDWLFKEDATLKLAEKDALTTIYYGDYESVNASLALEALSEGWRMTVQDPGPFIKTGQPSTPYLTKNSVCFQAPFHKDLERCLIKTWIYDDDCSKWIPLSHEVFEYDSKNKKASLTLSSGKFWNRDYGQIGKFCK